MAARFDDYISEVEERAKAGGPEAHRALGCLQRSLRDGP